MRIGIDARLAGETGLGRYTTRLVEELADLDSRHTFVLFVCEDGMKRFAGTGFELVPTEIKWYSVAEQLFFPRVVHSKKLDLFHVPHWNVPLQLRTPFVMTVHDLILLSHPSKRATTLGPLVYTVKSFAHRRVLKSAFKRARKIIAVSSHTSNQVKKYFPEAKERIAVIHEGAPSVSTSEVQVTRQFPEGPSVLYVGNAYPHKDLETLIKAVIGARKTAELNDLQLLWVGQDDYFSKRTRQSKSWLELGDAAHYLGPLSDNELAGVYKDVQALVTATREEGFGLTPLEAAAHGVPVIVSDIFVHREILGDAARFVPVGDVGAYTQAIKEVLKNRDLRERLILKGKEQVQKYSWSRMAKDTLYLYESV